MSVFALQKSLFERVLYGAGRKLLDDGESIKLNSNWTVTDAVSAQNTRSTIQTPTRERRAVRKLITTPAVLTQTAVIDPTANIFDPISRPNRTRTTLRIVSVSIFIQSNTFTVQQCRKRERSRFPAVNRCQD